MRKFFSAITNGTGEMKGSRADKVHHADWHRICNSSGHHRRAQLNLHAPQRVVGGKKLTVSNAAIPHWSPAGGHAVGVAKKTRVNTVYPNASRPDGK